MNIYQLDSNFFLKVGGLIRYLTIFQYIIFTPLRVKHYSLHLQNYEHLPKCVCVCVTIPLTFFFKALFRILKIVPGNI